MSMLSDAEVLWMCDNAYSEEEKVEARCEAYSRGLFN